MLQNGSQVFVSLPGKSGKRVLHPGNVLECDEMHFAARFESQLKLAVGDDLIAYATVRNKFMQQGAKVAEIRCAQPVSTIAFDRVGDVVSAESRQMYRVSTVALNITGRMGLTTPCNVVDISSAGLAIIAGCSFQFGSVVPVSFTWERQPVTAQCRVQTITPRDDGKTRYGLLAIDNSAQKTLERIAMAVQRRQLQRISGAA